MGLAKREVVERRPGLFERLVDGGGILRNGVNRSIGDWR